MRLYLAVRWAGALFFGFATIEALRLAFAETVFRQDTVGSIQRALAIQGSARLGGYVRRTAGGFGSYASQGGPRAGGGDESPVQLRLDLARAAPGVGSRTRRSRTVAVDGCGTRPDAPSGVDSLQLLFPTRESGEVLDVGRSIRLFPL